MFRRPFLVCAFAGATLSLSGCTPWDEVARADFVTALSCPADPGAVRERPDLRLAPYPWAAKARPALTLRERMPTAPPDIASDPPRMRL